MSRCIKIKLGDLEFRSKTEALSYVKNVVHTYERFVPIEPSNQGWFRFFSDLLGLHQYADEKIGCGIKFFMIRNNAVRAEFGEINFVRGDGSKGNFSYRNAISGRGFFCLNFSLVL